MGNVFVGVRRLLNYLTKAVIENTIMSIFIGRAGMRLFAFKHYVMYLGNSSVQGEVHIEELSKEAKWLHVYMYAENIYGAFLPNAPYICLGSTDLGLSVTIILLLKFGPCLVPHAKEIVFCSSADPSQGDDLPCVSARPD